MHPAHPLVSLPLVDLLHPLDPLAYVDPLSLSELALDSVVDSDVEASDVVPSADTVAMVATASAATAATAAAMAATAATAEAMVATAATVATVTVATGEQYLILVHSVNYLRI